MRTFDDFELGEEVPLGATAFDLDEMVAFARRWDPQPFHVEFDNQHGERAGDYIVSLLMARPSAAG